MPNRLEKLICLVTGGSTGIGAAVARELAQQGATVLITGRHEETLRTSAAQHPAIHYLVADVSKPADSGRVLEEIRTRYGRLDVLVNNAGIAPIRPLSDASPDHVREVLEVNVIGLVEITRQALPLLTASKGNVVNVASILGLGGRGTKLSLYCTSKGGVVNMTRDLAIELEPDIRVNCVCPGAVDTEMLQDLGRSLGKGDVEAGYAILTQGRPLKRVARAAEIANAIVFLASDLASYTTGAMQVVDGGVMAKAG